MKVKTLNDKDVNYKIRILRLKTYPDILNEDGLNPVKERREIEFLSTLGILDGDKDGNFYPDRNVTRRYLTRMMVNIAEIETSQPDYDLFTDVPKDDPDAEFIQAAIENGLLFAFPDGTFKPDQPLTRSEVTFLLNNAEIIDQEPEPTGLENNFITRKELAQFLAYTPQYEIRIERLIDWEVGYK